MRDVSQSPALRMLSLLTMEPPVSLDPDAVRDEKVELLPGAYPALRAARMALVEALRPGT